MTPSGLSAGQQIVRTPLIEEIERKPADPDDCADEQYRPNRFGSCVERRRLPGGVDDLPHIAGLLKHLGHGSLLLCPCLEPDSPYGRRGLQSLRNEKPLCTSAPTTSSPMRSYCSSAASTTGSPSRSTTVVSTTRNCRGSCRKPRSPNCAKRSRWRGGCAHHYVETPLEVGRERFRYQE